MTQTTKHLKKAQTSAILSCTSKSYFQSSTEIFFSNIWRIYSFRLQRLRYIASKPHAACVKFTYSSFKCKWVVFKFKASTQT